MCPFATKVLNPRYRKMSSALYHKFCIKCFGQSEAPDKYVVVSCGHCTYCRDRKKKEWRLRLLHEAASHKDNIFITLSVAPQYYKDFCENPAPFVRSFFDNLRKTSSCRKSPKHWLLTEGGSQEYDAHRYHLHGILFNVSKRTLTYNQIRRAWKFGYTWISQLTPALVSYVTTYITKSEYSFGKIFTSAGVGRCLEKYLHFDKSTHSFDHSAFAPKSRYRLPVSSYFRLRHRIPFHKLITVLRNRYLKGFFQEGYYHKGVFYSTFEQVRKVLRSEISEAVFDNIDLQDKLLKSNTFSKLILNYA